MNLYELNDCMKQAQEALENGASPDEVMAAISEIEIDFKTKCIQVAYFMQNLCGDIDAIKAQEDRLAKRRKATEAHYERMKQYLAENMRAASLSKADDGVIKVTCGKPKPMLVIDNEDDIPVDFKSIKTTVSVDKAALLSSLKDGAEVPGASIGESKPSIIIS